MRLCQYVSYIRYVSIRMAWLVSFALALGSVPGTMAATLDANSANSQLQFSGKHAGMAFNGQFTQWQSELVLPPTDNPKITATFDLSSAKTGDRTYDSTLPEGDWFDVKNHPVGKFVSTSIVPRADGFSVTGELTLRGVTQSVTFELNGNPETRLTAMISIDRLAYDIGKESDPDAEWVSRQIDLNLTINP